jgi:pimeloyl-ACP methyl ester carboxylesterase
MSEPNGPDQDFGTQIQRIAEEAKNVPDEDLTGFFRGATLLIQDPVHRRALEAVLLHHKRGIVGWTTAPPQVVVLVHGIRTEAAWQEPLAALLLAIPNVKARPVKYGYFDAFQFAVPFPRRFRRNPIEHLVQQLRILGAQTPNARMSVIAHSFGTYAISNALLENPDIKLYRLILCGSIVETRFRWDRISTQILKSPVLNECGTRDVWPIMANILTWGFGASGTFGFENVSPFNRFHDQDHSGFLKKEFYQAAWIPLFENPDLEPTAEEPRPRSPRCYSFLNLLPLRWFLLTTFILLVLGAVLLAVWWVAGHWVGPS